MKSPDPPGGAASVLPQPTRNKPSASEACVLAMFRLDPTLPAGSPYMVSVAHTPTGLPTRRQWQSRDVAGSSFTRVAEAVALLAGDGAVRLHDARGARRARHARTRILLRRVVDARAHRWVAV